MNARLSSRIRGAGMAAFVLLIAVMLTAFVGTGESIRRSASGECNKCWSDCDDPPPQSPCERYCYEPNCWECSGWEEDCLQGDCGDLITTYWEGTHNCGEVCPDESGQIVEECEPQTLLLDGTALIEAEFVTQGSVHSKLDQADGRTTVDDVKAGIVFRNACDGSIVGRAYTAVATAGLVRQLVSLNL